MQNSTRLARLLFPVVLSLCAISPNSAIATGAEMECRSAIQSGISRWLFETVRARQRCFSRLIDGYDLSAADCAAGSDSFELRTDLEMATRRLLADLTHRCTNVSWGLLSFPGPCQETGGSGFAANDLTACIKRLGGQVVTDFFRAWYPAFVDGARGQEAKCLRGVPRRAFAMVSGELRARLRCLLGLERGDESVVDCRAQQVPYGPGTGSASLDRMILHAHDAWLTKMPDACASADFSSLGYNTGCANASAASLIDLQRCVFETNRLRVPALVDLAFPSDPVCGNGIPQEGEQCDDGPSNSDTVADACREDCSVPVCGDGTTDPGNNESCDDGNSLSLDGCTGACILEVCGDGVVNDSPPEQCDDDNTVNSDNCTNACRFAACGDGVVCSSPACTTGPQGRPEQCDLGAANSPTGLCSTDCAGYSRSCALTIGVTNAVKLGALTYEIGYGQADGEFSGSGAAVQCTSLLSGGLVSFFDNETRRVLKESLISDAGVQAPASLARCTFGTNSTALTANAFTYTVLAASTPDFEPANPAVTITSILCQ